VAYTVRFKVTFQDIGGDIEGIVQDMDLVPGETRENIVSDIMNNGFRFEMKARDPKKDTDFSGQPFARRIAPHRVLSVDYELA
jgi:hypothetical protein